MGPSKAKKNFDNHILKDKNLHRVEITIQLMAKKRKELF